MAQQPLSPVQELVQKMREERLTLLHALKGVTEEQANVHPNGEWSVKQQVVHLANAERAWRDWGLALRKQPGLVFGPSVEEGQDVHPERDPVDEYPLQFWVTRLKTVRAESLRLLREADLQGADLTVKGRHQGFGEMNVIQALRSLYRHDRMHVDQVGGRQPTYQPGRRHASGV